MDRLASLASRDDHVTKSILIVEDNAELASLMRLHLGDIGMEADIAADGGQAVELFTSSQYDLVILDLMLPVMDGIEVCRRLRAKAEYVPIIMVTSKSSELDRVLGLEVGADDYITKPFSIPELLARVKARFRAIEAMQHKQAESEQPFKFGRLTIDFDKRRVEVDGREVSLTAKEFDLLACFVRHPGRVFTRLQLLDQVWGYHYEGYEHTVNSHINRLRAKIEKDPAKPDYVLTVWGVGYKFSDQATGRA